MSEHAHALAPAPALVTFPATLTLAGRYRQQLTVTGQVTRVGRRSIALEVDAEVPPDARFMWVKIGLPQGAVRPLVRVDDPAAGTLTARIKHLFPDDRERFDAWHAEQANASGY